MESLKNAIRSCFLAVFWRIAKKNHPHIPHNIFLVLTLIVASFFHLPQPVTMFLTLFAIFFVAWQTGWDVRADPCDRRHAHHRFAILFLNIGGILAAQSVLQTAWYYLGGKATTQSDLVILAIVLILIRDWRRISKTSPKTPHPDAFTGSVSPLHHLEHLTTIIFLFLIAFAAAAFVFWQSLAHATIEAIRTPWPLLPHGTLTAIALVGVCALLTARYAARSPFAPAVLAALSIAVVTAIAPIIYRNGYGYDGFIHRATEQVFLYAGTLAPKPPYYIGQYVFVTWLTRTFGFSLNAVDNALVPVAAFLIPFFAAFTFDRSRRAFAIIGLAFLFPFGAMIATTPQSFSYLLGIASVFLALTTTLPRKVPFLFALWAVAAHPLGGLPFLGSVTALGLQSSHRLLPIAHLQNKRALALLKTIIILLTILSVPLAFAFHSSRSSVSIQWNFSHLSIPFLLSSFPPFLFPAHATLWADWAMFVAWATPIVLLFLASYACIKNRDRRNTWLTLFILGVGTAAAGIFLNLVGDFTFLIDYERGQYAERLFIIAHLFLLPVALDGFATMIKRLFRQPGINILAGILLLSAWRAGAAYVALPRHDAAIVGHGWSVGRADQDAVRWIDQDASGRPYTVLANQSVSAAAVQAFGFKRYAGDVFYYPVPTGGKLYRLYLRAVEKDPSRSTVHEAAALGKSDIVYVVLNDYWQHADRAAQALEKTSDRSIAFDRGRVRVYRFDFKTDNNRDK